MENGVEVSSGHMSVPSNDLNSDYSNVMKRIADIADELRTAGSASLPVLRIGSIPLGYTLVRISGPSGRTAIVCSK
jgi:hypothetical protein